MIASIFEVAVAITPEQLNHAIINAKFPLDKQRVIEELIRNGLTNFRQYKDQKYISHTGKIIVKPQRAHATKMGRPHLKLARAILISALCQAWLIGFGKKARLNHKSAPMTQFHHFAQEVMAREGIGKIQEYLEEFWSFRKSEIKKNIKMATFRGE